MVPDQSPLSDPISPLYLPTTYRWQIQYWVLCLTLFPRYIYQQLTDDRYNTESSVWHYFPVISTNNLQMTHTILSPLSDTISPLYLPTTYRWHIQYWVLCLTLFPRYIYQQLTDDTYNTESSVWHYFPVISTNNLQMTHTILSPLSDTISLLFLPATYRWQIQYWVLCLTLFPCYIYQQLTDDTYNTESSVWHYFPVISTNNLQMTHTILSPLSDTISPLFLPATYRWHIQYWVLCLTLFPRYIYQQLTDDRHNTESSVWRYFPFISTSNLQMADTRLSPLSDTISLLFLPATYRWQIQYWVLCLTLFPCYIYQQLPDDRHNTESSVWHYFPVISTNNLQMTHTILSPLSDTISPSSLPAAYRWQIQDWVLCLTPFLLHLYQQLTDGRYKTESSVWHHFRFISTSNLRMTDTILSPLSHTISPYFYQQLTDDRYNTEASISHRFPVISTSNLRITDTILTSFLTAKMGRYCLCWVMERRLANSLTASFFSAITSENLWSAFRSSSLRSSSCT